MSGFVSDVGAPVTETQDWGIKEKAFEDLVVDEEKKKIKKQKKKKEEKQEYVSACWDMITFWRWKETKAREKLQGMGTCDGDASETVVCAEQEVCPLENETAL